MKTTKKLIIAILAIALVMTAALLPAVAETPSLSTDSAQAGAQMPDNGGQTPGNGQAPDANGQMPNDGTQMPNANGQFPGGMNGRGFGGRMQGGQPGGMGGRGGRGGMRGFMDLDRLVQDGAISQETREAIDAYLRENAPSGERTDAPAQAGDASETDLLEQLLSAGIITQEEHDAIAQAQAADRPQLPEGVPESAETAPNA